MKKKIIVQPLFKNFKNTIHLFIDIRHRSCTCFWTYNNAGLKKQWSFVWTEKWINCLLKCHVSFKVCTQLWTEFCTFRSALSYIRISEGLQYYLSVSFCFSICHFSEKLPSPTTRRVLLLQYTALTATRDPFKSHTVPGHVITAIPPFPHTSSWYGA
jgi:hypothetical protein